MNDAIRGAINAQLHEKHMTRSDLARAIEKTPQEVTRALNGTRGGGGVPAIWASMLDALGLDLVAVPREPGAAPVVTGLPSVPPADLGARVDEALKLLSGIKAGLAHDAAGGSTPSTAQDDGTGRPERQK